MKILHMLAFILAVVGGINWGLVGLGMLMGNTGWNLVNMLTTAASLPSTVEAVVYVLVGLSALWLLVSHKSSCRECVA